MTEHTKAPEGVNYLAVDADIVAYRVAAVCEDEPIEVVYDAVDEFLYNIVRATGLNTMVLCLTGDDNFRYKVAKTKPYKGNRKNIIRPIHLGAAKDYMRDKYNAVTYDNYEADDLIASYLTAYDDVAHAGIDKDIKQISGWHYNFVKRLWEFVTPEEAELLLYRQVCVGDSTDNIPGLKGIGEKKAAKLVPSALTARDDAKRAYEANCVSMTKEEVTEFFTEQLLLVGLVDVLSVDIQDQATIIVAPPEVEEDEDGDFMGFDDEGNELEEPEPENPKLEL